MTGRPVSADTSRMRRTRASSRKTETGRRGALRAQPCRPNPQIGRSAPKGGLSQTPALPMSADSISHAEVPQKTIIDHRPATSYRLKLRRPRTCRTGLFRPATTAHHCTAKGPPRPGAHTCTGRDGVPQGTVSHPMSTPSDKEDGCHQCGTPRSPRLP